MASLLDEAFPEVQESPQPTESLLDQAFPEVAAVGTGQAGGRSIFARGGRAPTPTLPRLPVAPVGRGGGEDIAAPPALPTEVVATAAEVRRTPPGRAPTPEELRRAGIVSPTDLSTVLTPTTPSEAVESLIGPTPTPPRLPVAPMSIGPLGTLRGGSLSTVATTPEERTAAYIAARKAGSVLRSAEQDARSAEIAAMGPLTGTLAVIGDELKRSSPFTAAKLGLKYSLSGQIGQILGGGGQITAEEQQYDPTLVDKFVEGIFNLAADPLTTTAFLLGSVPGAMGGRALAGALARRLGAPEAMQLLTRAAGQSVGGGATSFATFEAAQKALQQISATQRGEPTGAAATGEPFYGIRLGEVAKAAGRGAFLGGTMGAAGAAFTQPVLRLGAQVGVLATVPALQEGRPPTAADVIDAGILVAGLTVAGRVKDSARRALERPAGERTPIQQRLVDNLAPEVRDQIVTQAGQEIQARLDRLRTESEAMAGRLGTMEAETARTGLAVATEGQRQIEANREESARIRRETVTPQPINQPDLAEAVRVEVDRRLSDVLRSKPELADEMRRALGQAPLPTPPAQPPPVTQRVAPATFVGWQERLGGAPPLALYNLTEDIPGHPTGSTVGERTLREAGFEPPRPPEPPAVSTSAAQPPVLPPAPLAIATAPPSARRTESVALPETFEPSDVTQLVKFVRGRGGLAPSPTGDLAGEYRTLPLYLKNRRGLTPDRMAQAVSEAAGREVSDADLLAVLGRTGRLKAATVATETQAARGEAEAADLAGASDEALVRELVDRTGITEAQARDTVGRRPGATELTAEGAHVTAEGDQRAELRRALVDLYDAHPDEDVRPELFDLLPTFRDRFGDTKAVTDRLFGGDVAALTQEIQAAKAAAVGVSEARRRRAVESPEALIRRAERHYGTTDDWHEAGYIMPDGTMLDFSGRHYAPEGDKAYVSGRRDVDHREDLAEIMPDFDPGTASAPEGRRMREFMRRTGAVRFHPSVPGFDIGEDVIPTNAQLRRAIRAAREADQTLIIDGRGRSWEFDRPTIDEVRNALVEEGGISEARRQKRQNVGTQPQVPTSEAPPPQIQPSYERTPLGAQAVVPGSEARAIPTTKTRAVGRQATEPTPLEQAAQPRAPEQPSLPGVSEAIRNPAVGTPAFQRWFGESKVVDQNGQPMVVYRGDYRADRVGPKLKTRFATSGRFYFTDDPGIASSYAVNKEDVHARELLQDFSSQYTFPNPRGGRRLDLRQVWYALTPEEQATAKRVLLNSGRLDDGTLDFTGDHQLVGADTWQRYVREARGNWLEAAKELWLSSGTLFDLEDRAKFLDILRAAGLQRGEFDAAEIEHSAVTPAYLRIEHPLDTASIPDVVIERLRAIARSDRTRSRQSGSYDQWDKQRNAKVFMERLEDDLRGGTTFAWTSIPDKITQALQQMGYDGIKDKGGKRGGQEHTVWIAFEPWQVKSAIGNRGTFDIGSANISESARESARRTELPRRIEPAPIFYSTAQRVIEQKMAAAAPASIVKNMLVNAGVKADEMKWAGLDDFLGARGNQRVTKQEMLDFLRQNEVQRAHSIDITPEMRRSVMEEGQPSFMPRREGETSGQWRGRLIQSLEGGVPIGESGLKVTDAGQVFDHADLAAFAQRPYVAPVAEAVHHAFDATQRRLAIFDPRVAKPVFAGLSLDADQHAVTIHGVGSRDPVLVNLHAIYSDAIRGARVRGLPEAEAQAEARSNILDTIVHELTHQQRPMEHDRVFDDHLALNLRRVLSSRDEALRRLATALEAHHDTILRDADAIDDQTNAAGSERGVDRRVAPGEGVSEGGGGGVAASQAGRPRRAGNLPRAPSGAPEGVARPVAEPHIAPEREGSAPTFFERVQRTVGELAGERGAAGERSDLTLQTRGERRTFTPAAAERLADELRQEGRTVEIRVAPGAPALRQVFANLPAGQNAALRQATPPVEPPPPPPPTAVAGAPEEGRRPPTGDEAILATTPEVTSGVPREAPTAYVADPDIAAMVRSTKERGPFKERMRRAQQAIITQHVNQFESVRQITDALERAEQPAAEGRAPIEVMELAKNSIQGESQAFAIEYGRILDASQKDGLLTALRDYLTYRQFLTRLDVLERRGETQQGLGGQPRGLVNPRDFDRTKTEARLAEFEARLGAEGFARVQQSARAVWALNRRILDAAHEVGLIGDRGYETLTRRGDEYVPFQVLDFIAESGDIKAAPQPFDVKWQNIFKRMAGTEQDVRDVLAATYDKAFRSIATIHRNDAARSVTDLADALPDMIRRLESGEHGTVPGKTGVVSVFEQGKRVDYQVPEDIARSMKFLDAQQISMLGKILSVTKKPLQLGATGANVAFALPNAFRDAKRAAVYAKYGISSPTDAFRFVADWGRGIAHAYRQDEVYLRFLRSGAAFSTFQKGLTPEAFVRGYLGERTWRDRLNLAKALLDGAQHFNSLIEEAPKIATMLRGERSGATPEAIAYEVANYGGSPNFSRFGTIGHEMNLLFMFYNARLQGTAANLRRIRETPEIVGTLALYRIGALMLVPATALWAWNQQFAGDNGIDEVSDTDRQKYHVILLPETYQASDGRTRRKYLKIAKEETEQLLGPMLERGLDALNGADGQTWRKLLGDFLGNVSPISFDVKGESLESFARGSASGILSSLNPLLRIPTEVGANYNARTQGAIVPRGLSEHALPRDIRKPTTSPTATGIAAGVPEGIARVMNLNPVTVEYALTSGTGGLGQSVLDVADWMQGKALPETVSGWERTGRQPFLARVVGTGGGQRDRDTEEEFYRTLDRATRTAGSLKVVAQEGLESPRLQELVRDPDARLMIAVLPHLVQMGRTLAKLRQAQVSVTHHAAMPLVEKQNTLRRLADGRAAVLAGFRRIQAIQMPPLESTQPVASAERGQP